MTTPLSKSLKTQIFWLGLYQIIGGGIGILIIVWSLLFGKIEWNAITISLFALFLAFYIYSIFCGLLCLDAKKSALKQTLINQFLQVISFSFLGYAFNYVAGMFLTVGVDIDNLGALYLNWGLSTILLNINTDTQVSYINFNLIALGLVYYTFRLTQQIKREEEFNLI